MRSSDLPKVLNLKASNMAVEVQWFVNRFNDYIAANFADPTRIHDAQKLALFHQAMGAQALQRFDSGVAENNRATFATALIQFRALFGKALPITLAIVEFTSRKQRADEDSVSFLPELQVLAKGVLDNNGANATVEQYVVSLFIAGTTESDTREYLLEKSPATIEQCMEHYQRFQQNRHGADKLSASVNPGDDVDVHKVPTRNTQCYEW